MTTRRWGGRRTQQLTREVLEAYGTCCHLCGSEGADSPDHVIPRSKGGDDSIANLRPSHLACNIARKDADLPAWFARHPLPIRTALPPSREW